eukprot:10539175-Alexandrium_andersonii.AAC.1
MPPRQHEHTSAPESPRNAPKRAQVTTPPHLPPGTTPQARPLALAELQRGRANSASCAGSAL